MTERHEQPTTGEPADLSALSEPAAEVLLERLKAATLGEYEILGELGRGGMATVFLAHEISLDRKVAIKVMSPAMVHGSGMVERFKREARTAANLSHPNIIPIYAVREVDGLLFCVIKLVQGTPLDAIMYELEQLPVPMVQAILAQVGDALGYAHRQGVVHRDIKPGNILIDDEGWAVVTDFGIAKVLESGDGLTLTGMAVGTPTYMSPEQASSDNVSGASDQYSLGIVAYEMLAGRPPFTAKSTMALMFSHFQEEPPDLMALRADCPPDLAAAIMRMLRKDPAERWPTVEVAVAAMGARPLLHDDPTRDQLIRIAKTSSTHRIVAQVQTPRSPIPLTRKTPVPEAPRASRTRVATFSAGGVGLVVAGYLLARLANPSPAPTAAEATLPGSTQVAASTNDSTTALGAAPESPPSVSAASVAEPANPAPSLREQPPVGRGEAVSSAPVRDTASVTSGQASTTPTGVVLSVPLTRTPASTSTAAPPSSLATPPAAARTVNAEAEVTAVIMAYGRALADADLAGARRLYPAMPDEQRQGLEALWRDGGTMTPRWTVNDVVVSGDVATARVTGTNLVTIRRGAPSDVPVDLRARLERRGIEWRLTALVN